MSVDPDALLASALRTLRIEIQALETLSTRFDTGFTQACYLMSQCQGRVILMGMGKSGHIARKIAATLASTGTPAFFIHPAEASHGDMGMVTAQDVVLALSNSGETAEITLLLPLLKRLQIPVIACTGQADSTLARQADVHLDVSVPQEACPLNLAPTASTTAALVMGDALAIALLETRGFSAEDFAFSHPGGSLGRRLLLKVKDIMHQGERIPRALPHWPLKQALIEISRQGLGCVCVLDTQDHLIGIYTDGDLRRTLDQDLDWHQLTLAQVMSTSPSTIHPEALAVEALNLMQSKGINALPVVNQQQQLVGALNMHDLLSAGVF